MVISANNLSSDILENQFGSTYIEVLFQNDRERIICTKTVTKKKILELSCVKFIDDGVQKFSEIHSEIAAGKSMGKAFRDVGVLFVRDQKFAVRQEVPEIFQQRFDSMIPPTISKVQISVGPDHVPYAEILEIYSPDVEWALTDSIIPQKTIDDIESFGRKLTEL